MAEKPRQYPDDVLSAPNDESYYSGTDDATGGRYTAPSEEPGTWELQGLLKLETLVDAIGLQLIRGSVRNAGGIYRRRVTAFRESLQTTAAGWAIGRKLGTEVAKEAIKWITLVLTIWKNAKLQKEIEEALRRAAIQTQREVNSDIMDREHNRNSRLVEKVYTRNG